ncbi:hypothetical protein C0J52_07260 [Blattella germanica]|nr:hypothetical protein C0J52_07260 [Blattella germanica]
MDKTKAMITRRKIRKPEYFEMETQNMEIVNQFKYLGCSLTEDNEEINEIRKRIHAANRTYAALTNIFKTRDIHRQTKITLYMGIIRPVITYGSETWTLNKRTSKIINTFERIILRRIYGQVQEDGMWRIRYNTDMYRLYNNNDISTTIQLQRLQWAGHIIRMEESRIPKKILFSQIEGRRPVGKPRDRWIDAVTRDANTLLKTKRWKTIAKDRTKWRQMIKEAKARLRAVTP